MATANTIIDFMDRVLPDQFRGPSWASWRVLLKAMFALPLSVAELKVFTSLTGRQTAPEAASREVWAVCGRRAGKSFIAALVAVFLTTCRTYRFAPGEKATFMILAADRRQARVVKNYVAGLLHSTPVLEQLISRETQTEIELTNGITIEVHTASYRTIRGYSVVGAILDEVAFWPTDDAADPDKEILAAIRPAMATIPDAMLLCLSSPYARKGSLYEAWKRYFGKAGDVLVIQAETRALNSTVPQEVIARAYEEDPASAAAEFGAEFRKDVEAFLTVEAIDAVVVPGRVELPPSQANRYFGFLDFAGGSGADSATLAISHQVGQKDKKVAILDVIREVRPPFSPEQVCKEFATTLKQYGVHIARADRWAAGFVVEAMRRHGIQIKAAENTKSELYRELLPSINSQRVELLDVPRLHAQLVGLERRVARGGRDSIDHAPRAHDDVANAAAGALVEVSKRKPQSVVWGRKAKARRAESAAGGMSRREQRRLVRERVQFGREHKIGLSR